MLDGRLKKGFVQILAFVLCICTVLPSVSVAAPGAYEYEIEAAVDTQQSVNIYDKVLKALADLFDAFTVSGTITTNGGSFDSSAMLNAKKSGKGLAKIHAYGIDSDIMVESPLLGDERILLNMDQCLEFGLKAYFHLNVPLQRLALLSSVYVSTNVWKPIISEFNRTISENMVEVAEGKWEISNSAVCALAQFISSYADEDRQFKYWIKAVAAETGYDEYLMSIAFDLPEWFQTFSGGKDIVIEKSGSVEKWTCNDYVMFAADGGIWSASLPAFSDGSTFIASGDTSRSDNNTNATYSCRIKDSEDSDVLNAYIKSVGIPLEFDENVNASLICNASGALLPAEINLSSTTELNDGNLRISVCEGNKADPWLVVSGKLNSVPAEKVPEYTYQNLDIENAVNLFSINDTSLAELIDNVKTPFVVGALPVMTRVPASVYQVLMNFLDTSGILATLADGGLTEEYGD